ncbi:hypothetical protein [Bacillus sp. MUM 13]|uniref:hypothetical protein n=1 Tax=Bacillus sp. MUM 13 TaxID=1678001 RepID=UPI0008F567B0|nr:hypothetical protein [Bacillus sp. MUM 13]OIK07149.1 hypothetical protein BIV59_21195 [Bacillus sp. MUM 13]
MSFLVGVSEAGDILGWDRRKVSTYHLRGVLPAPVVNLSSGPIWFRNQIEQYKEGKELKVRIYYYDGQAVYECKLNQKRKKTDFSPQEIKEQVEASRLFKKEDIEELEIAIEENEFLVQFLSFEWMSLLHDYGLLGSEYFHLYLHRYTVQHLKYSEKSTEGLGES